MTVVTFLQPFGKGRSIGGQMEILHQIQCKEVHRKRTRNGGVIRSKDKIEDIFMHKNKFH